MTSELERVKGYLEEAASSLGVSLGDCAELTSSTFRGDIVGDEVLRPEQLPKIKLGLTIDGFPILLGLLPSKPDPHEVLEALRQFRNQCAVARSRLRPSQALDLNLFLIGPAGSDSVDEWEPLALSIERDDRVARKLVWRRPGSIADERTSFTNFISRTFLARPWSGAVKVKTFQLDRFTSSADELPAIGTSTAVLRKWSELVNTEVEPGAELVDRLVDAWKDGKRVHDLSQSNSADKL